MPYIGQTPSKVPLTSDDIADGTISNADLAGSITSAKITSLDATKLTGSIADARVPASAVTQHVTATDLTPIRQDLAMLALYNAVSDNRAAYNLPNSFIDQFEDDTGLTTQTNVDRNDRYEFVASMSSGAPYISPTNPSVNTAVSTSSPNLQQHGQTPGHIGSSVHDGNWGSYFDTQDGQNWQNGWLYEDYGSGNEKKFAQSALQLYGASCTGSYNVHASNDASNWTLIHTGAVGEFTTAASGSGTQTIGGLVYQFTAPATAYRYWKMTFSSATSGSTSSNDWSEIKFYEETIIANATGTVISDTQTASSATTKMSGVILYKDNAGTATLGTDLVISLSANGGTNWTEAASYGTVTPLFSTGVKMVRLGETTVTSGTTPVIKAVWANQASGSKETQLHGWAMNF